MDEAADGLACYVDFPRGAVELVGLTGLDLGRYKGEQERSLELPGSDKRAASDVACVPNEDNTGWRAPEGAAVVLEICVADVGQDEDRSLRVDRGANKSSWPLMRPL